MTDGRSHTPDPGAAGVPPASSSTPRTPLTTQPGAAGVPPAEPSVPASSFQFYDGDPRTHAGGNLSHREHAGAHYFITFRTHAGELTHTERAVVLDACLFWHGARFYLGAAVVMPDHVHLLLRIIQQPGGAWPTLPGLVHSIKSFSAHAILRARASTGRLWQREYFDKIIRSDGEYHRCVEYILLNPRRAGLGDPYPFVHRYESARVAGGQATLDRAAYLRSSASIPAGGTPASPASKDGNPASPTSRGMSAAPPPAPGPCP